MVGQWMWLLARRDHMPVRMIDGLLSCLLTGGHPCRVCATGEETQNSRSGPQRAGHYHRHRSEGERLIHVSVWGKKWQDDSKMIVNNQNALAVLVFWPLSLSKRLFCWACWSKYFRSQILRSFSTKWRWQVQFPKSSSSCFFFIY